MISSGDIHQFLKRFRLGNNFITIHYIYIISSILLGSLLIFAGHDIAYIDALYFAGGACTGAGLNPIDLNELNTWQQVSIFLLCMTCHVILINTAVVVVRFYWFNKTMEDIVVSSKQSLRTRMSMSSMSNEGDREHCTDGLQVQSRPQIGTQGLHGKSEFVFTESPLSSPIEACSNHPNSAPSNLEDDTISPLQENRSSHPTSGVIESPPLRKRAITFETPRKESDPRLQNGGISTQGSHDTEFTSSITRRTMQMLHPYLTFSPMVRRNSNFVDLSDEQWDELGGVEYRALQALLWVLPTYFFGFFFFSCICLIPWIIRDSSYSGILESDAINRPWWGFFTTASMYANVGFTLTPDGMISFQQAVFPLLVLGVIMIAGNTGFPCLLRFIIWILFKSSRDCSARKETYAFLLDHPRRCFTLLFPREATWWLFGVLLLFNGLDLFFFLVLDLGNSYVTSIPVGYRILDGLFQAISTRTTGVAVTNLQLLSPAVLVSYLVMMYISAYPVAMSIRRTNVYEEKSLGLYIPDEDENESLLATHIRRQLGFDLWYVFLGVFLICIIESSQIENTNDYWFNIFNVLFEVVSAYACVGLSIGYPTVNASFSSQFHTLSKLVMVALMIRGRHRGLPHAIDKAVMLPKPVNAGSLDSDRRSTLRRVSTSPSVFIKSQQIPGNKPSQE